MSVFQVLQVLLCVAMIAAGQVLFKSVGLNLKTPASLLEPKTALLFAASMAIYGLATILWIYVLRSIPLTKAYPFMAMAFLIVPILGVLFFNETVNVWYFVGTALIIGGVILINLTN